MEGRRVTLAGPRCTRRGGAFGADLWHGGLAEEAEESRSNYRRGAKDHKAAPGDIYNAAFSPLA